MQPVELTASELAFDSRHFAECSVAHAYRWRVDTSADNRHWIIDGPTVQRGCPLLWHWAHSKLVLDTCSQLAGEPVQVCPGRNSVNINWTAADVVAPHYDSNRFTLVTYLTDHPHDGALYIPSLGFKLQPRRGLSVFFAGQHHAHGVRPSATERQAVVICFDSVRDPNPRPPEQDRLMYGDGPCPINLT